MTVHRFAGSIKPPLVGLALLLPISALVLTLLLSRTLGAPEFEATISPGVTPHLATETVRELVVSRIDAMGSKVENATATGGIVAVATTVADASTLLDVGDLVGGGWDAKSIVWVVTAHGTFVADRGRGPDLPTADSGYFVIDDATGDIIAMGFPLPE